MRVHAHERKDKTSVHFLLFVLCMIVCFFVKFFVVCVCVYAYVCMYACMRMCACGVCGGGVVYVYMLSYEIIQRYVIHLGVYG